MQRVFRPLLSVAFHFKTMLKYSSNIFLKFYNLGNLRKWRCFLSVDAAKKEYVQGQSPAPHIREYFYYIDHLGQLFLDDARMKNFTSCFKDKEFLVFFFSRLRINESGRYSDAFPYVSLCGRERNFVRCDDLPIVYTHIFDKQIPGDNSQRTEAYIAYCNAGEKMAVKFDPEQLCMSPENGRVYYPASEKLGGVGLVRSALAMELSPHFRYEHGKQEQHPPSHIVWRGYEHRLTNAIWPLLRLRKLDKK